MMLSVSRNRPPASKGAVTVPASTVAPSASTRALNADGLYPSESKVPAILDGTPSSRTLGRGPKMPRCFVIQPFDGNRFDKRHEDIFAPAIRDAGLEPYRVDRDPGASVLFEDIERGIGGSQACLAEISLDNPNVWYELGYAIASSQEVVLVCSDERTTHFPFDVQHRAVITYSTESLSDFEEVRAKITARLRAVLSKRERLGELATLTSVSRVEGLEQYEIAILVALAQQPDALETGCNSQGIGRDIEQAGFTRLAATLGLKSLCNMWRKTLSTATTPRTSSHQKVWTGCLRTKTS